MGAKKKILIADDDPQFLELYGRKFSEEGFDVFPARDGQEAWEFIGQGIIPDVVFTGIMMPRMTGFDLIRKMQADPKLAPIPVAISSHRNRDEDRKMAQELGVDDFIAQTTTPLAEVVRRIKLLLGEAKAFTIRIKRGDDETERFLRLLEIQGSPRVPSDREVKLVIAPKREEGDFHITARQA